MHTSVISKFLRPSKSFKDEQADEWLQLKVDKNKIDNLLKLIGQKNTSGMYFSDKYQEITWNFFKSYHSRNTFELYSFLFQIWHCIILT